MKWVVVEYSGLFVPRPPGSWTTRTTWNYVPVGRRRGTEADEADVDERRLKKYLATRYSFQAKWDRLLADKDQQWVS